MTRKTLLEQVSNIARFRHLSLRTEEAYRNWIKRFIIFHGKQHPRELDGEAVRATAPIEMDSVIAAASPVANEHVSRPAGGHDTEHDTQHVNQAVLPAEDHVPERVGCVVLMRATRRSPPQFRRRIYGAPESGSGPFL
ncbi:MAG: phage integrase N-terminal SAM-like domain-containing protein [Acidobacteriota bacterium]